MKNKSIAVLVISLASITSTNATAGICTSGLLADIYCVVTGDVAGAKSADVIHGAIGAPLNQFDPRNANSGQPQPIYRPQPQPIYQPIYQPQVRLGQVCITPVMRCMVNVAQVASQCGCVGFNGIVNVGNVI